MKSEVAGLGELDRERLRRTNPRLYEQVSGKSLQDLPTKTLNELLKSGSMRGVPSSLKERLARAVSDEENKPVTAENLEGLLPTESVLAIERALDREERRLDMQDLQRRVP